MIRLEVQDYCQECTHFSANVILPHKVYVDERELQVAWEIKDTIVECKNRELCARLQKEFERMQKEKEV